MTEDPDGYIFYESEFRREPLSRRQIEEEIRQVQSPGMNCYKYGFISRSGFACEPDENMIFISLDDLYQ